MTVIKTGASVTVTGDCLAVMAHLAGGPIAAPPSVDAGLGFAAC